MLYFNIFDFSFS